MYACVDNESCSPEHLKCVSPEPTNMCMTLHLYLAWECKLYEICVEFIKFHDQGHA